MNNISEDIKRKFCRDNMLNIGVFTEPYFSDRVELYGMQRDWDKFMGTLNFSFHNNEKEFFEYNSTLKANVKDYIVNSDTYAAFKCEDISKYTTNNNIRNKDIYNDSNVGKVFISIDISKANFSSLVHYGYSIGKPLFETSENDRYSYEKFIGLFTDIDYFKRSKHLRQSIFGKCESERQSIYQKYIMQMIYNKILSTGVFRKEDTITFHNDEVVFDASNIEMSASNIFKVNELVNELCSEFMPVKFQWFKLGKIYGTSGYIKSIYFGDNKGEVELKCLNSIDTPFVKRMLKKESYRDSDYYFLYEGKLARLMECPNISIEYKLR